MMFLTYLKETTINIFVTSKCPIQSAKYLDTKRVSKMILESAQMLSTAIREHGYTDDDVYKSTHKNHPSNVWCRTTRANYMWLYEHYRALALEYYARRRKWHKSWEKLNVKLLEGAEWIPEGELTPFANCAANQSKGVSYKHIENTTIAYQLYLADRWETDVREPVWN
jgi:hypothetical protein